MGFQRQIKSCHHTGAPGHVAHALELHPHDLAGSIIPHRPRDSRVPYHYAARWQFAKTRFGPFDPFALFRGPHIFEFPQHLFPAAFGCSKESGHVLAVLSNIWLGGSCVFFSSSEFTNRIVARAFLRSRVLFGPDVAICSNVVRWIVSTVSSRLSVCFHLSRRLTTALQPTPGGAVGCSLGFWLFIAFGPVWLSLRR